MNVMVRMVRKIVHECEKKKVNKKNKFSDFKRYFLNYFFS